MIETGMILAAGFGTRLRPLTRSIPKPMVPLCNRPLIGWALESLVAAGVRRVIVNLHHQPRPIEDWLPRAAGDRVSIHFSHESEILGTGGGIRHARRLLESTGPFALVNGDTVQSPPFRKLVDARAESDSLAALLLRTPPADDRFTPVYYDAGRIVGIGEGSGTPLMFAGAHVISEAIFDLLPDRLFSGVVEDVYIPALQRGDLTIAGLHHDGWWFDIGTPRRLLTATKEMLSLIVSGSVDVPAGSIVNGDTLRADDASGEARASVLGMRCTVERGAHVNASLLMDDVVVRTEASVTDSILGPEVEVPPGFTCENAFVCARRGDEDEGNVVGGGRLVALPVDPALPWRAD